MHQEEAAAAALRGADDLDGIDQDCWLWVIVNLEIFWRHYLNAEPVTELEEWGRQAGQSLSNETLV